MKSKGALGRALNGSVLAVLVLVTILGTSSILVSRNLGSRLDQAINNTARQQMIAGQISTAAADLVAIERGLATATLLQRPEAAEAFKRDFEASDDLTRRLLDEFLGLSLAPSTRSLVEDLKADHAAAGRMHETIIAAMQRQEMDKALQMLESGLLPKLQQVSSGAKKLVEEQREQLKHVSESAASTELISLIVTVGVTLICLAMGGVAFMVVRRTTRTLRAISTRLADCAEHVSLGSDQITAASRTLAEGAARQAASLEETSASSQEMSSLTQRNAESTRQATALMDQVDAEVRNANITLEQMLQSMNEIRGSSEKIARIIKVIDEISFQTNILALNAAVEAARAGEAGMGFAVVAEEVRNLAGRCATAARDTAALIEESIQTSETGAEKLNMMASAIQSITRSAERVRTIVQQVNAGSEEQARGIEHVASALNQIERVTQQNAASSQESASASESMRSQADKLLDVVGQLVALVGESEEAEAVGRRA